MAFDAGTIKATFVADLGDFGAVFERVGKLVGGVGRAAKLAVIGVGAVGGAMTAATGAAFLLAKSASRIGDRFEKMSKRTGLTSETLSGLAFAAERSGTSIDAVETGLRGMVTRLRSAQDGSKEAIRGFASLGLTITDANGALRPMRDLLFDAADRLSQIDNQTERATAAQNAFGRSATTLLPLLQDGSAALSALTAQAAEYGATVSAGAASASAAFEDRLTDMKAALSGVRLELGRRLLPLFKPMIKSVTKGLVAFRKWSVRSGLLKRAFAAMSKVVAAIQRAIGKLVSSRAWDLFLDFGRELADSSIRVLSDLVNWIDSRLPSALDALAPVISQVGELIRVTFEVIRIAGLSALTVINDAFGTASSTATSSLQGIRELAKLTLITLAELLKLLVAASGAGLVLFQSGDRLQASLADIGRLGQQIEDAQRAIADIGIVGPPPQIQGVTQPDGRLATETGNRGRRRDTAETTVNITQNFATAPITTRQELSELMLEGIEAAAKLGQRTANFDPAATTS